MTENKITSSSSYQCPQCKKDPYQSPECFLVYAKVFCSVDCLREYEKEHGLEPSVIRDVAKYVESNEQQNLERRGSNER